MTPEQWQLIRPILESALEVEPSERAAFLDRECKDAAMRREIDSLFASHDRATAHKLEVAPPLQNLEIESARFRLVFGKRIGAYKILDEIAVGGMGAVYRAVRDDGQFVQEVAVKIVRAELGGEVASARFKNERQILASLDHSNIAKIFDGGVTEEGIPYLVMELIRGTPITEYCDEHRLTIAARLNLFRSVCSAVHYAHGHLVVHRDVKPSNILVTEDGIPKLLDFGIAKVVDAKAPTEKSELTMIGVAVMTPEYASPEQLRGEAVTIATDIYSLGMVLYRLLTGSPALIVASRLPHEIARAAAEQVPRKPSTVVMHRSEHDALNARIDPEAIAQLRSTTPHRLQRSLRGDLDNIVGKALQKNPRGRYASADQLSEDIRRHLDAEPVQARRPTLRYQLGRFIARHKAMMAAAAMAAVALVIGLVIALHEARIARTNELRAERRFNDVRKLANSMMFEVHDSILQLPGSTEARKLILQRAQEYLESLAKESNSDPSLLTELAAAYRQLATVQGNPDNSNLGDTRAAAESYRKAIALLESAAMIRLPDAITRRELALNYARLAGILGLTGDPDKVTYLKKAQQILEPLSAVDPTDADTGRVLGAVYVQIAQSQRNSRDFAGALAFYQKALATYDLLARTHPDIKMFRQNLSHSHRYVGTLLALQKQFPEALEHYKIASAMNAEQLAHEPDNPEIRFNATLSDSNIAFVLGEQGDVDAALGYYEKALAAREALLAVDPQDNRARTGLAETREYIGVNLLRKRNYSAALDSYQRALDTWEQFARTDPTNQEYAYELAWTQAGMGQAYAGMALNAKAAHESQLRYCRQSHKLITQALPKWIDGQTQIKLGIGDPSALTELKQSLADCDLVIARTERAVATNK